MALYYIKINPCGENVVPSLLSKDYSKIATFIDQKINEMNCQSTGGNQPVNEGLIAAGNMLSENS